MITKAKETFEFDAIDDVVSDVAKGKIVIVTDDADRENEGDWSSRPRKSHRKRSNFMATHGRGLIARADLERTRDAARPATHGRAKSPITQLTDHLLGCGARASLLASAHTSRHLSFALQTQIVAGRSEFSPACLPVASERWRAVFCVGPVIHRFGGRVPIWPTAGPSTHRRAL